MVFTKALLAVVLVGYAAAIKDCSAPPPTGSLSTVEIKRNPNGVQEAHYTCNPGLWWKDGQFVIPCRQPSGNWAAGAKGLECHKTVADPGTGSGGVAVGNCTTAPPAGVNSQVSLVILPGGGLEAHYKCDAGLWWKAGSFVISCEQFSGTWSPGSRPLECHNPAAALAAGAAGARRSNCSAAPPAGAHSTVSVITLPNGVQEAHYKCDAGLWWKAGQFVIPCERSTGMWAEGAKGLECHKTVADPGTGSGGVAVGNCTAAPPAGVNSQVSLVILPGGGLEAHYKCDAGLWWKAGSFVIACEQFSGTWSPGSRPLECHNPYAPGAGGSDCSVAPPAGANSTVSVVTLLNGVQEAHYKCDDGLWWKAGQFVIPCERSTGTWAEGAKGLECHAEL